jgi:hypothetical protein
MSRPLRLLALTTAAALTLSLAPVTAFADSSSDTLGGTPTTTSRTPASQPSTGAVPAAYGPSTVATPAPALRVESLTRSDQRTDARRTDTKPVGKQWPVRTRKGDATYHPVTPQGDVSQNFRRVVMVQDRLTGTMTVGVALQGTPTAEQNLRLRVGFGMIRDSGTGPVCTPTARSVDVDRNSYNAAGGSFTYTVRLAGARTEAYNCSFAILLSGDETVVYDAVTDARLAEARQKPILDFKFKGKTLKPRGFTKIPLRIVNSRFTVATATKVRLKIKTRGVAVRYNLRVGRIKPGQGKRGAIYVRDTARGTGFVTLILRSKDYKKKITVKVREVRR